MSLTWESPYAVAVDLRRLHPEAELEDVTLGQIYQWTLQLADFDDDPAVCNDEILAAIYQEWYEVILHE
jgi:FeS assembly protein IscX